MTGRSIWGVKTIASDDVCKDICGGVYPAFSCSCKFETVCGESRSDNVFADTRGEYVYNYLHLSYGWYFTLLQGLCFMTIVLATGFRPSQKVNSWGAYFNLSFFLTVGMGLTRGSLKYLNYPAQIVFKSSKVIPVMLMGPFFPKLRRRYTAVDYSSAVMLVAGLILFVLADASVTPQFRFMGVVLISLALVCDAFIGNQQETLFTVSAISQEEMLFCTTAVGVPILMVPLVLTGELWTAWNKCLEKPHVYVLMIGSSMIAYISQMAVLSLVALFGAAATYMVTTTRKAFTVLLSYIIFAKPFTEQHMTGLLLICMALTLKAIPDPFSGSSSAKTSKPRGGIAPESQVRPLRTASPQGKQHDEEQGRERT
ncbi:hypothetical protein CBR_g8950 [Chara braunii]|uniref:Sugar phosphate transporter domain-containing protein n=1 Tax=Chara braunii TaxID=69332 RepID=A0A388KNA6_CHABU|nr:hypothetical protein CBR_g8950 [Chara braunii]|eukprot:GBG71532.1 hypothetical protein CBR_g8950 [Chara braunii]